MTPQEFAALAAANPNDYPLVEKIIDKPDLVSFASLYQTSTDTDRKVIEVAVRDHDFVLTDTGWERRPPATWTMLVTDRMKVGVYDAQTGEPKTRTESHPTGQYLPYVGEIAEGVEPPLGEPIFADVEVQITITEWEMWLNYIFFNAKVSMREAFRQGILKRKGLDTTPLKYYE